MNSAKSISPPLLKKGDLIGIVSPASRVSKEKVAAGAQLLINQGFKIKYGTFFDKGNTNFAASDEERTADVQKMLDDPSIRAIFFSRGGYGSVRIIDELNFTQFLKHPKWLIGFSDITIFINHVYQQYQVKTIHGAMPGTFLENSDASFSSIISILTKGSTHYQLQPHLLNRPGNAKGVLVGGNLSIINSLMGSKSLPNFKGKILFIEDIGEYIYHIDRMMQMLKRAGLLAGLKGLVVGQFSDLKDTQPPFGLSIEKVIYDAVKEYKYPVLFNFPAGHVLDNRALIMGQEVNLGVNKETCSLIY